MGQGSKLAGEKQSVEDDSFPNISLALAQGTHKRLGASSPLQLLDSCDLLMEILRFVPLVVPDHCETLKEAISMAISGQIIRIRRGEHIVGANIGQSVVPGKQESGATILEIRKNVTLVGEPGTVLRGMLHIRNGGASGRIQDLTIHDAGQCCLKAECGYWEVDNCFLMCGHACAVRGEGDAVIQARRTRFGGEGEIGQCVAQEYDLPRTWVDTAGSVQEYGLRKNACYGAFVRDEAAVQLEECEVSYCSESAVFMRDNGSVSLKRCVVSRCGVAFTAGDNCMGGLAVDEGCSLKEIPRRWYDDDRPPLLSLPVDSELLAARA